MHDKQIAKDVQAFQYSARLPVPVHHRGERFRGHTTDELVAEIDGLVAASGRRAPRKTGSGRQDQLRVRFYQSLRTISRKADMLVYNTVTGDPDFIGKDLQRYLDLDVTRVHEAREGLAASRQAGRPARHSHDQEAGGQLTCAPPRSRRSALALPALALACGPKAPPPAPPVDPGPPQKPEHRTNQPAPLDKRDFNLPTAQATLSNGLRVVLVENHEVPLVYVNLVNTQGGWTDPAGRKDLPRRPWTCSTRRWQARCRRHLGGPSGNRGQSRTSAGLDGSGVSVQVMKKEADPALDIMADVALRPTFPRPTGT